MRLPLAIALASATLFAGCSSGSGSGSGNGSGGGSGNPLVEAALRSLSGVVREPDGSAIAGATVREVGGDEAVTNDDGAFVLLGVTPGDEAIVEIDGTAVAEPGSRFGVVRLAVHLGDAQRALLGQPVVLPNLLAAAGSSTDAAIDAGGLEDDLDLVDPTGAYRLSGPAGTSVVGTSEPSLFVALQPVAKDELPAPLAEGRTAIAAAFVEASGATFDPPLDLQLAGSGGDAGVDFDVLRFDRTTGAWTDPVAVGTGVFLAGGPGSVVDADGAVSEGGTFVAVSAEAPDCTTTVIGRVLDRVNQVGVPGVGVRLSTGDFATTDVDGVFRIEDVAAYDLAAQEQGLCEPADVVLDLETPPMTGSVQAQRTLLAGEIAIGGETDAETFELDLDTTGAVAGVVLGDLAPGEPVEIRALVGGSPSALVAQVEPSASGAFFADDLEAGGYEVSYLFPGDELRTAGRFEIGPGFLTTVAVQEGDPGPSQPPSTGPGLTVTVLSVGELSAALDDYQPVEGAIVRVHGFATGMTGSDGTVSFPDVAQDAGPFTVTAQNDVEFVFGQSSTTFRQAATVVDHGAPDGAVGLLMAFGEEFTIPGQPDANIAGEVAFGPFPDQQVTVEAVRDDGIVDATDTVSIAGEGFFDLPVFSGEEYDLVVKVQDPASGATLGFVLRDLGGPLGSGQTLNQNVDLASPELVAFDQDVEVDFVGVPAIQGDASIFLNLYDSNGRFVSSFDAYVGPPVETTVQLPASSSLPSGSRVGLEFRLLGAADLATESNCELFVESTAGPFQVDLPELAAVTTPQEGQSIPLAEMQTLQVQVQLQEPGGNGLNTFNFSGLVSPTEISGVDFFFWTLHARKDVSTVDLSSIQLPDPVFHANQDVTAFFDEITLEGETVDFENLFGADAAESSASALTAADEICFSRRAIDVRVTD